ncbi:hypothetical protein M5689_023857 [Euphorbia peplus]|nr:hypothetical protein M5689_023857 [Euphorbia peplus]
MGAEPTTEHIEEDPNPKAQQFFDMLNSADTEVFPGCQKHSQLSITARLLNLKSEHRLSERCYDSVIEVIKELILEENKLPNDFYGTKKLVHSLGLPVEKIDCCKHGCMIYWGVDIDLNSCKFCGHLRFKHQTGASSRKSKISFKQMYYFPIAPRLQRLYTSKATASHMRWHSEHEQQEGVMSHPSESLAWKHFNATHPSFAAESRNVRLGLCTDGFQPFGQSGQQYSSWPVIVTPYNLPPWMCMSEAYMFLSVIVPGPDNPKNKLDVFLQPLIAELKQLWEDGMQTYDVSLKQNFQLRAALMWTISDFPAYSMLSGWTTAGKRACPYCMDKSQAFTLPNGGKTSWFDSHRIFLPTNHPFRRNRKSFKKNRTEVGTAPPIMTGEEILQQLNELGLLKVTDLQYEEVNVHICKTCGWKKRSIFWDLPYWKTNLIRHILDVMHIEKNVFDNVFNTVMNIEGKTKDNPKAREDLKLFCNRKELEKQADGNCPKACYTLDKRQKKLMCEWVKELKFPDGYVSNLGRCVDLKKLKLFGMKSHDCHVFMQRLLPIAFRELLPVNVWEALTELSLFFKELTSAEIKVEDMERLEVQIPIIICKLEKIFPPAFFDSMEHLPVHLPYEAKIAGPVQYRWMYPFERFLQHLKKNVKNKARVEGSICNAYLVEEASTFCSHYFEPHVSSRFHRVPRNDEGENLEPIPNNLSIFTYPVRLSGKSVSRMMSDLEYKAAQIYILLNTVEVQDYKELYVSELRYVNPSISETEIDDQLDQNFVDWFKQYASNNVIENRFIHDLAQGPLRLVKSYPICFVNGYRFHTTSHGTRRSTMNSGVCIKGGNYSETSSDYYGRLIEVLELEYPALPIKKTILFNCEWFDPRGNIGMKVHDRYKLVDVNTQRHFQKYEPFILAMQAAQVYYVSYPSLKRDKIDWVAVCKVKPSRVVVAQNSSTQNTEAAYQEDGVLGIDIDVTQAEDQVMNDQNEEFVVPTDDEENVQSEDQLERESNDTDVELEDDLDDYSD